MTSTSDITQLLDQLDEAHAAATPGPWGMDEDAAGGYDLTRPDGDFLTDRLGALSLDDAALIVAAVNTLPQLTAAIRAVLGPHSPCCNPPSAWTETTAACDCSGCPAGTEWPCPTVSAITTALAPPEEAA